MNWSGIRPLLGKFKRRLAAGIGSHLPLNSEVFGPPRGYYQTVYDWADNYCAAENRASTIRNVYPPEPFKRQWAKTVETIQPPAFRHLPEETLPAADVAFIPDGRFVGSDMAIISPDDKVILDVSLFFAPYYHDVFYTAKLPRAQTIAEPVVVLAIAPGYNYYHWLQQVLPRLDLIEKAGLNLSEVGTFIINDCHAPFIRQSLELLGISENRCLFAGQDAHIKSSNLIVSSVPPGGNAQSWVFDFLRRRFLACIPERKRPPHRRLYLSRKLALRRQFTNDEQVEALLVKHGFETVLADDLTFLEQVELFSQACAVLSLHSSALTSMAFCDPGTKIIEIYSPKFPEILWWNMACQMGHEYYYMLGEGERRDFPYNIEDNWSDVKCDLNKLEATLKLAGLA